MRNFRLSPKDIFPKQTEIKNDKYLSELSLKIMQTAVFNNINNPLNVEDNIYLQSALEIYARWLKAQGIIHLEGDTNAKRKEVLDLLELGKSKKTEIKYRDLRHLYIQKTSFSKNPSCAVKIKAVLDIKKQLKYPSNNATIKALRRASIKGGGMQELNLPGTENISKYDEDK